MLSIERIREILDDPHLSDEEITEIRDSFRILVEIIFEKWKKDCGKSTNNESNM